MTLMAAAPIYGKNPSKIFFSNTSGPISTKLGYVALGTPAHDILFKWWPWVDLDLFYGNVKFGIIKFSVGKSENSVFFSETIAASDLKVGRSRHLIQLSMRVKVISWLRPQDIYIWKLKLVFFLKKHWAIFNQILYVSFQVQEIENLMTWCWSHDQDGRHAHIW